MSHSEIHPFPAADETVRSVPGDATISVAVAHSQLLFRAGLVAILRDDCRFSVIGHTATGAEAMDICRSVPVDVLIMDLEVGSMPAVHLIDSVAKVSPGTRVLVLASAADARVVPCLAAGAGGYVLKDTEPEAILAAIAAVRTGTRVLSDDALKYLLSADSKGRRLTRRETEVARMLAAGSANLDIAETLAISDKTVRNYVSRVYRKLELNHRSQVTLYEAEELR